MPITGTVTLAPAGKRLKYATIKLISAASDADFESIFAESDKDGNFTFPNDRVENLESGEYRIVAYHQYADQGSSIPIKWEQGASLHLSIELNGHPVSRTTGIVFVGILILSLLGLLYLYYDFHEKYPKDRSADLESMLVLVSDQISEDTSHLNLQLSHLADSLVVRKRSKASIDSFLHEHTQRWEQDTMKAWRFSFRSVEDIFHGMKESSYVGSSSKGEIVSALVDNFYKARTLADRVIILNTLRTELAVSDEDRRTFNLWNSYPWLYFEVIFWAMIATVIRLIIHNSGYTYYNRFRPYVIPRQLGFIVCIPVLALLISFILSLIKFEISAEAFKLRLDLSNVFIAIVIASIIGFAPFRAWTFLRSIADGFFDKLLGYFAKIGLVQSSSSEAQEKGDSKDDPEDEENGDQEGEEESKVESVVEPAQDPEEGQNLGETPPEIPEENQKEEDDL